MFELSSSLDGNNQTSCIENDKAMNSHVYLLGIGLKKYVCIAENKIPKPKSNFKKNM